MYLIFKNDAILLEEHKKGFVLPTDKTLEDTLLTNHTAFSLITTEGTFNLYDLHDSVEAPEGYRFADFRYECRDYHFESLYGVAIQGLNLLHWSRKNNFCGVCGAPFNPMNPDKSKSCSNCNNLAFPQTSMAVITAIHKDDQILLAHNANFPEGLYSLVAGFVELGETLEDAVAREIYEEVGLKVKNIRYFGSQPWPFPNSMMIGFTADYESGEINTDDIEIVDADWFLPENFPEIPHEYSIARKIINSYTAKVTQL